MPTLLLLLASVLTPQATLFWFLIVTEKRLAETLVTFSASLGNICGLLMCEAMFLLPGHKCRHLATPRNF